MGLIVGRNEGAPDGKGLGTCVGESVGAYDGWALEGKGDGAPVGTKLGT